MKRNIGVIITLVAAVFWGFSGTCAQYIFDNFDADPTYLTAVRLLAAGLILVIIGLFTDRKNMISIWTDRTSALRLIIFSVTGFLFCQLTYMKAISYSNSGTATILQYLGPVLIMIVSCFLARKLPKRKEVCAIIMALIGVFFIATHGRIDTMVITPLGLSWGLWSAVALMLYTMLPGKIIDKYGSITVTGYGMLMGGIILCIGCGIWNAPMVYDIRCIIAFIAIVLFGTILPFTMYLVGVNRCGAVKASMLHRAGGCHCLHGRLAESASANYGYSRFYVYLCDYFPADQERITSIRRRQPADVAGCFFCIKFDK